ncbi:MAG: hypothetical protein IKX86_04390 [Clostridia bacterium]|nr:hypothetical protein [Clostridia bacterium]
MKKRFLPLLLAAALCVSALVISPGADQAAGADGKAVSLVFGTMNSMTAERPETDSAIVLLEGYKSPNDGGGGTFVWDASSTEQANGGTVVAPSSGDGRFIRVCDPGELNALWFGALSGDVEDGAAIQAAIDALPASGGTVKLPGGSYRIETPIVIGDGTGNRTAVKLIGEGASFGHMTLGMTTLRCSKEMDAVITVKGPISDCKISGIRVNAEHDANYALRITGMGYSRVEQVGASGGKIATWLIESAPGEDGATHDCLFRQAGGHPLKAGSTVMIIDGGESGNPVRNCIFEACRFDTAQSSDSVAVHMKLAEGNTFRRCHFNVYQFETSIGLLLDPEGNDGYPKQNAFYDCSVTRLKISEPEGAEIGYNYVFGHGTWDNEEYTPSDKLFGLTDLGEIVWYGATGKK